MPKPSRPTRRELWGAHLLYSAGQPDAAKLQKLVDDLGLTPPRKQAATRPRTEREGGIQDAILHMLRLHPRVAWAVRMNAGAYKTDDGRFIKFGFVGCPDLWFQVRPSGRLGVIEVKRPGQAPTEAQQQFLGMVQAAGGIAGVCRSVDEAAALLEAAGVWNR